MYTIEDVCRAAAAVNFSKAMGPDGFDGKILGRDKELDDRIFADITKALNTWRILEYLTEGRLIPLSKRKGQTIVEIDDIRPIVVKSHIAKIMETALLQRIEDKYPHLIRTGLYQKASRKASAQRHASPAP